MKTFFSVFFAGMLVAARAFSADLTVEGDETRVISGDAAYDLVTVRGNGSLVVGNGATLTVTGCLVGRENASILIDRGTVRGRINVESGRKFHLLDATLLNTDEGPTDSLVNSNSVIISRSRVETVGPTARYYTPGGGARIEFRSANDIRISHSRIINAAGTGVGGYEGPQPDGPGRLLVQTAGRLFLEGATELRSTGCPAWVTLSAGRIYVDGASLNAVGKTGGGGNVLLQAREINLSAGTLDARGGAGLPGAVHGGQIYAMPGGGGGAQVTVAAVGMVNLAGNVLRTIGGAGGYMPPNPAGIGPGSPGSGKITISSQEDHGPSLYGNSYYGQSALEISPPGLDGAPASTVRSAVRRIEDFEDRDFWSPASTLGWWDIDDTRVYSRSLVDYNTAVSVKTMRTSFNKNGLGWSLFGGFLAPGHPARDFRPFNTVRVWAQGDAPLLLKLRDRALREQDAGVQRMDDAGSMARLDFHYAGLSSIDLSDVDNLLFFAAPGDDWAQGTFFINAVELVNTRPLEDFERPGLWNPADRLGWWNADRERVYRHRPETAFCHEGSSCMRTDYDKTGLPWSYFAGHLSPGHPAADIRPYDKLSFWLRGDVSLLVRIQDRAAVRQDAGLVRGDARGWKRVELDLTNLAIDKSDVAQIFFYAQPGQGGAGTFYLDDFKFE